MVRIIVELEDDVPISYLNEFASFILHFRWVKAARVVVDERVREERALTKEISTRA